jgi:O-methyltransferase domain/Dimerisation domain
MSVPTQQWAQRDDVHEQMADMLMGYRVSQALRAYAELSVADHLANGPLTAAEIAQREGSAPETTFRLMRAGLTLGLLTMDAGERFHSTALLDTLRRDAPGSLRGMALGLTNRSSWWPWGEFVTAVRTGQTQTREVLGMPIFEYLQQNPEQSQEVTSLMEGVTSLWARDLVGAIDTSDVALAVDVGGANGALLRLLQQANPALRGIVFDRPDVAAAVKADIAGDRTEVVGGDFFEALPAADLYLLKCVLHDWDDESCVKILNRCREAMVPGGRIAIIESLIGDRDDPGVAALMDLNMLAMATGKERTLAEYDALLAKAGLRRTAVRTSDSPQSIVETVAAPTVGPNQGA